MWTDPPYANRRTVSLPAPTNFTNELTRHAFKGLRRIFRAGRRYKKAGVLLTGLVPETSARRNLFRRGEGLRLWRVIEAMAAINADLGSDAVGVASTGLLRPWSMRCSRRSPRYTGRRDELPLAKAPDPLTAATPMRGGVTKEGLSWLDSQPGRPYTLR